MIQKQATATVEPTLGEVWDLLVTILERQDELDRKIDEVLACQQTQTRGTVDDAAIIQPILATNAEPDDDIQLTAAEIVQLRQVDHAVSEALGCINNERRVGAWLRRCKGKTIAGRRIVYNDRSRTWLLTHVRM